MSSTITQKTIKAIDLAQQLGISRNVAYNAIKEGKIPGAVRIGRKWLIPIDAADRLLNMSSNEVRI